MQYWRFVLRSSIKEVRSDVAKHELPVRLMAKVLPGTSRRMRQLQFRNAYTALHVEYTSACMQNFLRHAITCSKPRCTLLSLTRECLA